LEFLDDTRNDDEIVIWSELVRWEGRAGDDVFDDSTINDTTTSWAGSELIGIVWDSDQHDERNKSRDRPTRDFKEHDGQSVS
jgi:hypothetical protein